MEPEDDEIDHLLANRDDLDDKPQLSHISLEELLSAQFHDRFCSEICRRLNEGENLSFPHENNGVMVVKINTDSKIVILHSLKKEC